MGLKLKGKRSIVEVPVDNKLVVGISISILINSFIIFIRTILLNDCLNFFD